LREAVALGERDGFSLLLVVFPVLWDLDREYPFAAIHSTVCAFAEDLGLRALNLAPAFSGFEGPELWAHPTNQHPNKLAHEVAGEALRAYLVESGLVEQSH
jgi:hypothetical protein